MSRAIVAVSNKNARIIWATLNRNEEFRAAIWARSKDCRTAKEMNRPANCVE